MTVLTNRWMAKLKNSNHYSTALEIYNFCVASGIDTPAFVTATEDLHTACQAEDVAYKKLSKDWNVERLKAEDRKMDLLMIGLRKILDGHASMPDDEPLKQPAKELLQMWKEFDFSTSDGYSSEASKVINMVQIVNEHQADAEAMGVLGYFNRAATQAQTVLQLVSGRTDQRSRRVVGEIRNARAATDAAVHQLYAIINSMQVLMPSEALAVLVAQQKAIENDARQYYLDGGGSASGKPSSKPKPSTSTTPDTPAEPADDPSHDPAGSQTASYQLNLTTSGSGSASLTGPDAQPINSGDSVAAGTSVTLTVVPVAGKIPEATLNGAPLTLSASQSGYSASFIMPAAGSVVAVNTEPSSGGANDDENGME
jgi:hypothetical protein